MKTFLSKYLRIKLGLIFILYLYKLRYICISVGSQVDMPPTPGQYAVVRSTSLIVNIRREDIFIRH